MDYTDVSRNREGILPPLKEEMEMPGNTYELVDAKNIFIVWPCVVQRHGKETLERNPFTAGRMRWQSVGEGSQW